MEPDFARRVVDHSPDGLWVIDARGRTVWGNERLAEILGRPHDSLVGLDVEDLVDETGREHFRAHVAAMVAGHPGEQNVDALMFRPDGCPVWALVSWAPLPDESGEVTGWLHRVSEYTQRKLLVDALRERQHQAAEATRRLHLLQQMAEAANKSSSLAEALGAAASALTRHSGWDPVGVLVDDDGALVPLPLPLTPPAWLAGPDPALAARCRASRQVELAPAPGHEDTHTRVAVPVVVGDDVVCVIEMVADEAPPDRHSQELIVQIVDQLSRVAERERSAEELAAARDAAMTASLLKSEFLATMSHEIRTPMNGVIGLNELLLRTDLDERQRRLAESQRGAGLTLLALLNDVLDLSKIESGKLELEAEDLEVRSVLEQTAAVLVGPAHEKGLELVVACHPDVPTWLNGDAVRLGQVLTNLGSNAVKFTDHGEVSMRVRLEQVDAEGVLLRVEVSDTGIGIAAEQRDRLFDAFAQADLSTTRRHGGTGLGLAISRRLVDAWGGEIGLDSEPGRGTTFWFTARLRHARTLRPRPEVPEVVRGRRVLAVVGSATTRAVLEEQLRAWECTVDAVGTPESALGAIARASYDVVLVDRVLGDVDGVALAARLRAGAGDEAPPVVLLAHDQALLPSQARAAGVVATLTKPVPAADLLDGLLVALGGEVTSRERARPRSRAAVGTSGVRVLVVEDNAVNQLVATGLLESLGCHVEVAGDGAEAVERLTGAHDVDLVLMDCRMPLLDGFDATREIRRREQQGSRVPIVAMTASALEGERERCLAAGMDDFLTKPVDPPLLARAVFRWVPAARRTTVVPDDGGPGRGSRADGADGAGGADASGVADGLVDLERVAMLHELVRDGVSFFEKTRMSFLSRIDLALADLRGAVSDGDAARITAIAHQLKGSALNLGLTRVGVAAAALEDHARTGAVDGLEPLVDALVEAVRDGVDALARVRP